MHRSIFKSKAGFPARTRLSNFKVYEHPISNTQFPISIGINLTWTLDIPYWILDILNQNDRLESLSYIKKGFNINHGQTAKD